jgi:hypothetical protein
LRAEIDVAHRPHGSTCPRMSSRVSRATMWASSREASRLAWISLATKVSSVLASSRAAWWCVSPWGKGLLRRFRSRPALARAGGFSRKMAALAD